MHLNKYDHIREYMLESDSIFMSVIDALHLYIHRNLTPC